MGRMKAKMVGVRGLPIASAVIALNHAILRPSLLGLGGAALVAGAIVGCEYFRYKTKRIPYDPLNRLAKTEDRRVREQARLKRMTLRRLTSGPFGNKAAKAAARGDLKEALISALTP